MRKKTFLINLLVFIVIIGATAGCLIVVMDKVNLGGEFLYSLTLIAGFALGLPIHLLFHELAHVLFGKFAGFKFQSINVCGLRFSKTAGKWHIIKNKSKTAGGYTSGIPTKTDRIASRYACFVFGGWLATMLMFLGSVLLLFLGAGINIYVYLFFSGGCIIHACMAFLNLPPLNLNGAKTDGGYLFGIMFKNKSTQVAVNGALIDAMLYSGTRISDIPSDLMFNYPVIADNDTSAVIMFSKQYYYYLERGETEQAHKTIERIYEVFDSVFDVYMTALAGDIFYDAVAYSKDYVRATKMLPLVNNAIAMDINICTLRVKMAKELYYDNKPELAMLTGRAALSAKDDYPMPVIADLEELLINDMMKKAIEIKINESLQTDKM